MDNIPASAKTSLMSLKRSKRRKWTEDETKLFLKCFLQRKHEFLSRKKKFAYKRVLKDMIVQGFKDKSVTHSNLEGKMRTLSIAYNTCKDEIFPNKASAYIKPYLEELDIIFGSQMKFMAQQSTDSTKQNWFIKTENEFGDNELDSSSHSETYDPLKAQDTANIALDSILFENITQGRESTGIDADENISDQETNKKSRAQHEYYEAMLELKRHDLALKTKYYGEMMLMEKQKLELLTKIAEKLDKT